MEAFTDGLWHYVSVDIVASQGPAVGRVNVTVDGRPDVSNRKLTFTSASEFLIGGMFVSKDVDERRLVLFTVVSFLCRNQRPDLAGERPLLEMNGDIL